MLVHGSNDNPSRKALISVGGTSTLHPVPPVSAVRFRLLFDPNPPPLWPSTEEEAKATEEKEKKNPEDNAPNDAKRSGGPNGQIHAHTGAATGAAAAKARTKAGDVNPQEEEEDICWGGAYSESNGSNGNHKNLTKATATTVPLKRMTGHAAQTKTTGRAAETPASSCFAPSLSPSPASATSTMPTQEEVVVPIKQHLSTVTVDYLTQEFKRRLQRKYPLLSAVMNVSHYLLRQPNDTNIMDLPSLEEKGEDGSETSSGRHRSSPARPVSYNRSSPVSSSAAAGTSYSSASSSPSPSSPAGPTLFFGGAVDKGSNASPEERAPHLYWRIDAKMNFDDTLDDFFMPPSSGTGEVRQYELVVVWEVPPPKKEGKEKEAPAQGADVFPGTGTFGVHSDPQGHASSSMAKPMPSRKPVLPPRSSEQSLGECLRLSEAKMNEKARQKLFFPPAPTISVTQRSTYLDLLKQRATRREEDKEQTYHRIIRERQTGEKVPEAWSDQPNGSVVSRLDEARHAARVALGKVEREAREALQADETNAFDQLLELASESWRHALTLLTLQENFLTNGQWVAMVRRHMKYPFDTEPLAKLPTPQEREELRLQSDDTAVMSFCFRDMEAVRKAKLKAEAEERARLAEAARDHFRDEMLDLALEERAREKKARRNERRVEFFREQGYADEDIPPPTPTPPPTPPPPRDPTLDDLDAAYEDLLSVYLDFRHEIIALERKDFREMAQLMRAVLMRQERADEAAVRLAYEEELQATAALNLDAYLSYDLAELEQETEYEAPWVIAAREQQQAEEERRIKEAEGVKKHAETETELIDVVHRETEEEFRARLAAERYNPFRPDRRENERPPAHDDVEFVDQHSEDRLQRKLEGVRFAFKEKKAREAIISAQREEMQSIFDAADLVLQKVQ